MIVRNPKKAVIDCTFCPHGKPWGTSAGRSAPGKDSFMHPFYEDKQDEFRCTLTRDITFPAHLHSAVELIYILEGSLEVSVQNQTKRIRKDEAALIFPDMVHSYLTRDACQGILCIFSPAYAGEYYPFFRRQQPECPFFSAGRRNPDISLSFRRMLHYREQSRSVSEAWLNLILAFLLSEAVLLPRDGQESTDVGYRLISYVSQHFQEPLTLDSLARELHFNKYYISRVFTARLHCGFYEYVNRLRLDYAARQLRMTDLRITAIWQDAGFESQKTFNRNFLSCYHMTPSQYRRAQALSGTAR